MPDSGLEGEHHLGTARVQNHNRIRFSDFDACMPKSSSNNSSKKGSVAHTHLCYDAPCVYLEAFKAFKLNCSLVFVKSSSPPQRSRLGNDSAR
jgi:hypothetical protein